MSKFHSLCICFFFNDTATTEIYPLSLHDALPIYGCATTLLVSIRRPVRSTGGLSRSSSARTAHSGRRHAAQAVRGGCKPRFGDRESKRLKSSHPHISHARFCL